MILTLFIISTLAACNNSDAVTDKPTFSTKEESINRFLEENPQSDVEYIKTIDDDKVFVVRSGNHQYSVYEMKNSGDGYLVDKLTATLSLHNTIAGSAEFTTAEGNEYTFLVVKKGEVNELMESVARENKFTPIFSDTAELSLVKEKNSDSTLLKGAIQSSETISDSTSS